MKSRLSIILLCLLTMFGMAKAQKKANLDRVKAQKVAYITDKLALTPAESEKFWPVYWEYSQKVQQLRRDNKPSKPIEQLTESEANALINQDLDAEMKAVELKKTYYREFLKTIPATKLAKLDLAERGFKKELIRVIGERRGRK